MKTEDVNNKVAENEKDDTKLLNPEAARMLLQIMNSRALHKMKHAMAEATLKKQVEKMRKELEDDLEQGSAPFDDQH